MLQLAELIMLNGMQTNSSMPGVERLTISKLRPDLGLKSDFTLSVGELGTENPVAGGIPPHGVFLTKGWTRCYAMNVVLLFAYENPDVVKARRLTQ